MSYIDPSVDPDNINPEKAEEQEKDLIALHEHEQEQHENGV